MSDPRDCLRLARKHTGKQPTHTGFLFGSVLSTTDADNWRHQRNSLNLAFLPKASLEKVLPVSIARAAVCADRLQQLSEGGTKPVEVGVVWPGLCSLLACSSSCWLPFAPPLLPQPLPLLRMNDFFLHETQAQLQLGMFGETEEFMEATNVKFRRILAGEQLGDVVPLLQQVLERARLPERVGPARGNGPGGAGTGRVADCAIKGPLSARLAATEDLRAGESEAARHLSQLGNALILEFAGHDTTGHTLTFLAFELARNLSIQRRLHEECQAFWARRAAEGRSQALGGTASDPGMAYSDLRELPFLTRCVTETMRLWGVVPQGTSRTLLSDDVVHVGDERVALPKGTHVQILNWTRHRNPELWGADVLEFNPDRDFAVQELWGQVGFAAYNPHTERFSPFTHPPRDCIGACPFGLASTLDQPPR